MNETCNTAFKEWSAVCDALGSGRQSIILRKGGIAEDGGEFKPEFPRFWLFPTRVHQQEQGIKRVVPVTASAAPASGLLAIRHLATVERVFRTASLPALLDLDAYHVWTPETVEKRFHYREPGLYVLVVSVAALPAAAERINHPEYDGCKTWVHLKEGIETVDVSPVLPAATLRQRLYDIESILNPRRAV